MAEDTITIRINEEEKKLLEQIKEFLGLTNQYGGDSKAIKACLYFTKNVTHDLFGQKLGGLFYKRKPSNTSLDFDKDVQSGSWNG